MKTKLKIKTLMTVAVASKLAQFQWTVNQIKEHVVRVAAHCRTKRQALQAMDESVTW